MDRRDFLKLGALAGASFLPFNFVQADEKSDFEKFVEKCEIYSPRFSYSSNNISPWMTPTLWPHQLRLAKQLENCFTIGSCFRQGGFSTLYELFALWKAMSLPDQAIFIIQKNFRPYFQPSFVKFRSDKFKENLRFNSIWTFNGYRRQFENGSRIFYTTNIEACRGCLINYAIIDQAAFVDDLERNACILRTATERLCLTSSLSPTPNYFDELLEMVKSPRWGRRSSHFSDALYTCDYKEYPEHPTLLSNFKTKEQFSLEILQKRI